MWKLKCFMRGCPRRTAKCSSKIPMKRQSKRRIVLKDKKSAVVELLMKGRPPYPLKMWTKELLVKALSALKGTQKGNKFIGKVISLRNSPYEHRSAICNMYKKWG